MLSLPWRTTSYYFLFASYFLLLSSHFLPLCKAASNFSRIHSCIKSSFFKPLCRASFSTDSNSSCSKCTCIFFPLLNTGSATSSSKSSKSVISCVSQKRANSAIESVLGNACFVIYVSIFCIVLFLFGSSPELLRDTPCRPENELSHKISIDQSLFAQGRNTWDFHL